MSEPPPDTPEKKRPLWVYIVPPILLLAAAGGAIAMAMVLRPQPEQAEPVPVYPEVTVAVAQEEPIVVHVDSQGVVQARTETNLVAEVSGRVEWISPTLFAGGFFQKGETLARIEDSDYRANLATARSRLAEAELAYQQELASADQAREDWEQMGRGEANPLTLRQPQLERAKASLQAARQGVEIALRDLDRTEIKAPYAGRVREKLIDIGQNVVARNTPVARIYSVDIAEIRLPISIEDTRYIDLPEIYLEGRAASRGAKPRVNISATYAGREHHWQGIIDRTEGAIDSRTRLAYVVAQVEDPYASRIDADRPPLKVGMFVRASIEGKRLPAGFRIPRQAINERNTVYLVDDSGRLDFKKVSIYKSDTEDVIIDNGLQNGDRICLTPLEYAVDGMQVTIADETAAPQPIASTRP